MKENKGKGVAQALGDGFNAFSVPEIPCLAHPRASNVGVCAHCLKDRLLTLVCSECGEQRLSSCSCSDYHSSNRNSCTYEVGSVGRISFLLENEKQGMESIGSGLMKSLVAADKSEDVVVLRRSSSSCVESKRSGIWRIGNLFRRRKRSGKRRGEDLGQSTLCSKSEMWVLDGMPVSRSRSLCHFRGSENWNPSGARTSSVNGNLGTTDVDRKSCYSEAEMRRSGCSDTEMRMSCFSEADARKSAGIEGAFETGNPDGTRLNRRVFSLKESDYFGCTDEGNFIDLKFFSASESKLEESSTKATGNCSKQGKGLVGEGSELRIGSCRVTARDKKYGMKKREEGSNRTFMVWRWAFRHHQSKSQSQSQSRQPLQSPVAMSEYGKKR
ncbi:hypothetical protein MLD38_007482 [Melastoma candidum]|uniref:Uncharacterized protein n=1 Tax=Melastoma candidum TaxID=119954 RepID=A0ACB9RUA0_9MYRT|nr:hypothetical protein MLD38_007482 [Melastoma candidum]